MYAKIKCTFYKYQLSWHVNVSYDLKTKVHFASWDSVYLDVK